MSLPPKRVPDDLIFDFAYVQLGPRTEGVVFSLSVGFRDETRDPPEAGLFEHEWVVSRTVLEAAKARCETDFVLLQTRSEEEAVFREIIERTLRETGTRLVRVGPDLVRRRTA